jgi:hypothetical protein
MDLNFEPHRHKALKAFERFAFAYKILFDIDWEMVDNGVLGRRSCLVMQDYRILTSPLSTSTSDVVECCLI